jgi:hypothetical protein
MIIMIRRRREIMMRGDGDEEEEESEVENDDADMSDVERIRRSRACESTKESMLKRSPVNVAYLSSFR